MSETHVGFLYNAASCLLPSENNKVKNILRSYYLMRCDEISKSAALPNRYFSSKVRCQHCCIEWDKKTETRVEPRKFTRQQRRRLRIKAVKDPNLLKELTYNKELKQICKFCNHITKTPLAKLNREKHPEKISGIKEVSKEKPKVVENKVTQKQKKKPQEINVYANSKDIFSLRNNDNTLKSVMKEPLRVIKNNKKKKDKFAGLCQKAVLASARIKEEQKKQNKLNLFLKPST